MTELKCHALIEVIERDWLMFKKRHVTGGGKKTVKMQESQFKMKTSPWSMIGHFKTQTNRKW